MTQTIYDRIYSTLSYLSRTYGSPISEEFKDPARFKLFVDSQIARKGLNVDGKIGFGLMRGSREYNSETSWLKQLEGELKVPASNELAELKAKWNNIAAIEARLAELKDGDTFLPF